MSIWKCCVTMGLNLMKRMCLIFLIEGLGTVLRTLLMNSGMCINIWDGATHLID
jgi:hypothetical protein